MEGWLYINGGLARDKECRSKRDPASASAMRVPDARLEVDAADVREKGAFRARRDLRETKMRKSNSKSKSV